ncbi:hypothetical protein NMY22_g11782 [Coprinellus aureogranulatus]|nr:hypothetical protein NMY22_g11782 [Coprinellus aureogranulatus]
MSSSSTSLQPSGALKRSCSALNSDNTCSACGKSFGAQHLLSKHQRSKCIQTFDEIQEIRKRLADQQNAKRRRVSAGNTPSSTSESITHASETQTGDSNEPCALSGSAASTSHSQPQEMSDIEHEDVSQGRRTLQAHDESSPLLERQSVSNEEPSFGLRRESTTFSPQMDKFRLSKRYDGNRLSGNDPDLSLSSLDLYDSLNHLDEPEAPPSEPSPSADGSSSAPAEVGEGGTSIQSVKADPTAGKNSAQSEKDNPLCPIPKPLFLRSGRVVLTGPNFSLDDIKSTKWTGVFQRLGKNKEDIQPDKSHWIDDSGWKTTPIEIDVPIHSQMERGQGVEKRLAGTLHHRSIVSILEEKVRNSHCAKTFQLDGHELLWKPGGSDESPAFRVISELYNSDAFLQAQREIRANPPPEALKDCTLPRVVVGVMLWSDATHMSTFSTSKLWPLYMLFGNESKYWRGKDEVDSCYHVAYFDTLSDDFKDHITERTGGKVPPNLAAYLNREFFHAQWVVILDDELVKAVVEGVVIEDSDGVKRRYFIRIFTYSADYPERVLIATIKNQSDCPCVRCLREKRHLNQMGTVEDIAFRKAYPRTDSASRQQEVINARKAIAGGLAVGGDSITRLLSHSGVPIANAFSARLSHTGFDIYSTLVVDILHEYEIGVFKALFLHLLRVLDASARGHALVHELDKRYRAVPTFNQTIRRFSSNVSQLRRRAARDYEDILQCAIPAFHGLLPEGLDALVSDLLYVNARWHALAKLRMHTEATLILLEKATSELGDRFRGFIQAVEEIETVETPAEADTKHNSYSSPLTETMSSQLYRFLGPKTKALYHKGRSLAEYSSPNLVVSATGPSFEGLEGQITDYGSIATCLELRPEQEREKLAPMDVVCHLGLHAKHVQSSPLRFLRTLFLTEKHATLIHFDRSGAQYTSFVNVHNDPHTFVRLVLTISSFDERELGFDTSIRWRVEDGVKKSGTIGLLDRGRVYTEYKMLDVNPIMMHYDIRGRGLRLWKVQDPGTRESLFIKDAWISEEHTPEYLHLERVQGIPGVVQMKAFHVCRSHTRAFRGFPADHEITGHLLSVPHRRESRIVLEAYGNNLVLCVVEEQVIGAFRDVIAGLANLRESGLYHRDVSSGNVLLGKKNAPPGERGVLIDLDMACSILPLVRGSDDTGVSPIGQIRTCSNSRRKFTYVGFTMRRVNIRARFDFVLCPVPSPYVQVFGPAEFLI